MSDDNGVKRDDKGRVLSGGANLRQKTQRISAKRISRGLKKEYVRRYANEPVGKTGEVLGEAGALLKHYLVLMDIMENPDERSQDRTKAAVELANRMDGKPVDEVTLSGEITTGSPLDKAVTQMTPEQLLELVRAARGH